MALIIHALKSRVFSIILKYISLPQNIMENSISTGTKEFASTHHGRAREKGNNYGFRRVLSAEVLLLVAVREVRGSPAVPSTASRLFQISFCRIRKLDPASASDLHY